MTIPRRIINLANQRTGQTCALVKDKGAYAPITWGEYRARFEKVAAKLLELGILPGDRIGILSHTRFEWAVADMAVLAVGAATVPIYPNLPPHDIGKLLAHSGCKGLFVAGAQDAIALEGELHNIGFVIAFDRDESQKSLVSLEYLDEIYKSPPPKEGFLGERVDAVDGGSLATIIYTSGTTGEPKGVELTHNNILTDIDSVLTLFDIGPRDVCLSHLPLAHVFERVCGYYLMLICGATIAYAENMHTVAQDMALARPTVCISVPRIFEKIYSALVSKAVSSPFPIRKLTFWAIELANSCAAKRGRGETLSFFDKVQTSLADFLVYKKVRAKFGGRVRFFVSGGAPLNPELMRFFDYIGVPVMEGYGLTETSPVIAANTPQVKKVGSVGRHIPGLLCKIADDGEILVKGPSVFARYHKDEAATADAFEGGWFKTGDIGELDSNGILTITDRKKDIIVTAGGKNIAPQKIENILKMDKYIFEVMAYGDKRQYLTALIVPDFNWLERYAGWKNISFASRSELVANPAILDFYARRLAKIQSEAKLASFETVKKFVLLDHEFMMSDNEITPTLKIKRKIVTAKYSKRLESLYESGDR